MIGNTGIKIPSRIGHQESETLCMFLASSRPDQYIKACFELNNLLPEFIFSDFSLIPDILKTYCNYRGIAPETLTGNKQLNSVYSDYRKELLALLLLCYHPEKLHNLTRKRCWEGLQIQAAETLACNPKSLANTIPIIAVWYSHTPEFRDQVNAAHAFIIEKYRNVKGLQVRHNTFFVTPR